MSCSKLVKEYQLNPNDSVATNDLPGIWVCISQVDKNGLRTLKLQYMGDNTNFEETTFHIMFEIETRQVGFGPTTMVIQPQQLIGMESKTFSVLDKTAPIKLIFTVYFMKDISLNSSRPSLFAGHDTTDPGNPHDQILVVGEMKFYVNKSVLILYSSFFDCLFNGNFEDGKKEEIELKEVDAEEFKTLLHLIHPTNVAVNAENFEYLWKLADRFGIPSVAKMCEEFLCSSGGKQLGNLTISDRMKMAQKYNSEQLINALLDLMEKLKM